MQGSINFDGSLIGNITGGGGGGGSEVVITPVLTSGTKIADVTVDGEDKDLFAPTPTPPTPATEVSVTQTLASGTKIGSIEVDGESIDLFAPTPTPPTPATEVSVTQVLTEGTKIASIEVDGDSTDIYSPNYSGDISSLQTGLSTANSNITALQRKMTTAEGNITTLQSDMTDAESIIGDGQLDIGNDLTDAVNEINQSLSDLTPLEKTASGTIVTFDDGSDLPMPSLKVAIEPQQDLHGYDSPWVGGAGKNKFAGSYYNNYMSENNGVFANIESDTLSVFRFIVQAFNGSDLIASSSQKVISSSGRYYVSITIPTSGTSLKIKHNGSSKDLGINCQFTATGTFTISLNVTKTNPSTVGGLEFKDVQIESGSQMTSYAPYSNICPISGWDEVNVTRTGKNVWGYGIGSADVTGIYWGWHIPYNTKATIKLFDKGNSGDITNLYFGFTENGNNADGEVNWMIRAGVVENTTLETTTQHFISIYQANQEALDKLFNRFNVMVTVDGQSNSTYEPYNGQTYTIDLDGTRYGGTLDVVSGLLTITDGYIASYNSETLPSTWISDRDVYTEGTTPTVGAEVVYKLANPQTYQLTPTQVKSLLGVNNIWADTGDIKELIYFRNTNITQAIKDIINTITAEDIAINTPD